ncbi:MAG: LrgB family protein [Rhodospirillaceae bacterium]|nr:LrgB family protein [Rhodospirillaceae bacterium]
MTEEFYRIWVYLSTEPLLGLTVTLVAYQAGMWVYSKGKLNPLLNPVLIAVVILVGLLMLTGTDYQTYFDGAKFVHFMLGPATVALAVPLYSQFQKVKSTFPVILASILFGSATAALSAIGIAWVMGASEQTLLSLAPKSVTAPIAMGIAEAVGGVPSLTAVLVILTGIIGAVIGPGVLNLFRIKDWRARGVAGGTASHGIGTARALQVSEVAGAFASLAMGLNGLATAILLPILLGWLF